MSQDRSDEERGEKAEEREKEDQAAKDEVKALEEDPPQDLKDWPSGKAKYETFGGPEHETSYEESATEKLGPAEVRHLEDGSVEVAGEKVDNPEDYKGEPIPGGPTDPDAEGMIKDRGQKKEELEEKDTDGSTGA